VNAELGGRWQVDRRLAGGWNEGAYLLRGDGGSRVVLKWRASDPERLLGAQERVAGAGGRYTFMGSLDPYPGFKMPATGC
jgi:hypothetical protein